MKRAQIYKVSCWHIIIGHQVQLVCWFSNLPNTHSEPLGFNSNRALLSAWRIVSRWYTKPTFSNCFILWMEDIKRSVNCLNNTFKNITSGAKMCRWSIVAGTDKIQVTNCTNIQEGNWHNASCLHWIDHACNNQAGSIKLYATYTHLVPIAAARQCPDIFGFTDNKALDNRSYKWSNMWKCTLSKKLTTCIHCWVETILGKMLCKFDTEHVQSWFHCFTWNLVIYTEKTS